MIETALSGMNSNHHQTQHCVITRLVLDDFRSWKHVECTFQPGVTILEGSNGLGKTNIVEAIEVLSTGTSHRAASLSSVIARGTSHATIRARVGNYSDMTELSGETSASATIPSTTLEVTINSRGANRGRINGGSSLYLRDVIGNVPSVTFAPDDQRLITDDPARRRDFLDQACSLLYPGYGALRQTFEKIARQRSALLKNLSQTTGADEHAAALSGLEIWTGQFIDLGMELTQRRQRSVEELSSLFEDIHSVLTSNGSGLAHDAGMKYLPSFDEMIEAMSRRENVRDSSDWDAAREGISSHFRRIFAGEVAQGRNLIGPHRDDVLFELDGAPAREFASNGEIWTMALSLRLALFDLLKQKNGIEPIVVLDDVFAQLDENRRSRIMDFVNARSQVIITTAALSDIPPLSGAKVVDVRSLRDQVSGSLL